MDCQEKQRLTDHYVTAASHAATAARNVSGFVGDTQAFRSAMVTVVQTHKDADIARHELRIHTADHGC